MGFAGNTLPHDLIISVIIAALVGNFLGSLVVKGISDEQFKTVGRYTIMVIGTIYNAKGVLELRA